MKRRITIAAVTAALLGSSQAFALEMRPVLSRAMATAAIEGCRMQAKREGWKVAITVVDDAGRLVAFERMDGAFTKATDISRLKAETAGMTPFSTIALRGYVYKNPDEPHGIQHVPGIVVFEGGEPIKTADGVQIGAIGVSGSSSANDGTCARAGLAAIDAELR